MKVYRDRVQIADFHYFRYLISAFIIHVSHFSTIKNVLNLTYIM